jgi:PPOX class probable F420-dependent enzyme
MRRMTDDEIRGFLSEGTRTGKLATVRVDGRPHVAPVWFVLDGDEVVFTTSGDTVKGANLDREGRAALAVDLEEPPYAFVTVEGAVSISEDPGEMLFFATRIGGRYMGVDRAEEYGRRNAVEGEWLVRLRLDKLIGLTDISD